MEKVLDVYKRPYNPDNPVICMDESPKQLISESRTGQKMKPGQVCRIDYEYVRHGVVNVFIANEPLMGADYENNSIQDQERLGIISSGYSQSLL